MSKKIFQILLPYFELYNNGSIEKKVEDPKKEIFISFLKTLFVYTLQNFDIDKAHQAYSTALKLRPNKIRRDCQRNLTLAEAIVTFEKFYEDYDEIGIINQFGIPKEDLITIRKDIESFKVSINFKKIDYKTLAIIEIDPLDKHQKNPFYNIKEIILSKQNQELKSRIINCATKDIEKYKAQFLSLLDENDWRYQEKVFTNQNLDIDIIALIMLEASINYAQKFKNTIEYSYEDFCDEYLKNGLLTGIEINNGIEKIMFIIGNIYLENKLDIILLNFHDMIEIANNQTIQSIKKYTNKSLYQSYLKWCKKEDKTPLIKLSFKTQKVRTNEQVHKNVSLVGKLHFERKFIFNNSEKYTIRDIVVPFYKRLLQLLIDKEILDPKTTENNFLFVLGYGSETKDDFERIEIVKPKEKQSQYTGKSTIIHLLFLLGYNLEEIRGNGNIKEKRREKDLILKNCFQPDFKASDFQHLTKPKRIISEIVKKAYLEAPANAHNPNFIKQLNEYIKGKG